MFTLTESALKYIRKNGGNAIVSMEFVPAMGGWACKGEQLWGSYVPNINIGKAEEGSSYLKEEIDGVNIWYSSRLAVKSDYDAILIKTKSVIFAKWLEMEGAQGIASLIEKEAAS